MLIARLLLCLGFAAPAIALETIPWVGQKVVAKYDYPLKVGDRVVPTRGFDVYEVLLKLYKQLALGERSSISMRSSRNPTAA